MGRLPWEPAWGEQVGWGPSRGLNSGGTGMGCVWGSCGVSRGGCRLGRAALKTLWSWGGGFSEACKRLREVNLEKEEMGQGWDPGREGYCGEEGVWVLNQKPRML